MRGNRAASPHSLEADASLREALLADAFDDMQHDVEMLLNMDVQPGESVDLTRLHELFHAAAALAAPGLVDEPA